MYPSDFARKLHVHVGQNVHVSMAEQLPTSHRFDTGKRHALFPPKLAISSFCCVHAYTAAASYACMQLACNNDQNVLAGVDCMSIIISATVTPLPPSGTHTHSTAEA